MSGVAAGKCDSSRAKSREVRIAPDMSDYRKLAFCTRPGPRKRRTSFAARSHASPLGFESHGVALLQCESAERSPRSRAPGRHHANQGDHRKTGRCVKRGPIVVIFVEEHAADGRPENP